jgi:hypothetical protein
MEELAATLSGGSPKPQARPRSLPVRWRKPAAIHASPTDFASHPPFPSHPRERGSVGRPRRKPAEEPRAGRTIRKLRAAAFPLHHPLFAYAPRAGKDRGEMTVLHFLVARPYIGGVGACSDYGDKRARNKRTGPGCDSRRLHQLLPSALSAELRGADQHRQTSKGVLLSLGLTHRSGS